MKLIIVVAEHKNGRTQYIEHQVGYGTALRMVLIDVVRHIKRKIK